MNSVPFDSVVEVVFLAIAAAGATGYVCGFIDGYMTQKALGVYRRWRAHRRAAQ